MQDEYDISKPFFSIVIPTFNRSILLSRALSSIRRQVFRRFEVIVVDDGSVPSSSAVVKQFDDLPLRFLYCDCNAGAAAARNRGIAISRGKYITFLDDDDEYLPTFLQSTHRLLCSSACPQFTWCGAELINYDEVRKGRAVVTARTFADAMGTGGSLEDLFSIGIGFGVAIHADCLRTVGGFDDKLRTVEDTDLFFRLVMANYRPGVVEGVHLRLHNHQQSRLTGVANHERRIQECRWLLERYDAFLDTQPVLRSQLHWQISNLQKVLLCSEDTGELSGRGLR